MEVVSIAWIAIKAPKTIFEELFLKHPQANRLQITSPCGRKVVAWSEEIKLDVLRKISSMTGATEAEVLLAATVDSLKEYFRHSGVRIPDDVLATGKFVEQRAIFLRNHQARGILCLALPTKTPLFEDDLVEILQVCMVIKLIIKVDQRTSLRTVLPRLCLDHSCLEQFC